MIGLLLWYNPEPGVGVVWCEDQGPLAFLGPDVAFPDSPRPPESGDQLVVEVETRDGVRYVSAVCRHTVRVGGVDPGEILSGYHQTRADERNLKVVA